MAIDGAYEAPNDGARLFTTCVRRRFKTLTFHAFAKCDVDFRNADACRRGDSLYRDDIEDIGLILFSNDGPSTRRKISEKSAFTYPAYDQATR